MVVNCSLSTVSNSQLNNYFLKQIYIRVIRPRTAIKMPNAAIKSVTARKSTLGMDVAAQV